MYVTIVLGQHGLAQDIAFESIYLTDPIEFHIDGELGRKVHRIRIDGQLGAAGTLSLDGNVCSIDEFGESSVCTLVYYPEIKIELTEISSDGGWKLYGVVPETRVANFTIRLAVGSDAPTSPTLLLNSHIAPEVILHSVLLRPASIRPTSKAKPHDSKEHVVEISGFKFAPKILTINAGDTVVWINEDQARHNAERGKPSPFKTKLLAKGDKSKPVTFREKGRLNYVCGPHSSFMKGTILVE